MRAVWHRRHMAISVREVCFPGAMHADYMCGDVVVERRHVRRVRNVAAQCKTESQYVGIETIPGTIAKNCAAEVFRATYVKWQFSD